LYSLQNRPEKLAKGSLFCLFLKLVQINFIFTDNVRILYIYLIMISWFLGYFKINIWSVCSRVRVRIMVFNTTFNNISVISWRSVLLMEETGVPRENH
jgi:hypothetical protein